MYLALCSYDSRSLASRIHVPRKVPHAYMQVVSGERGHTAVLELNNPFPSAPPRFSVCLVFPIPVACFASSPVPASSAPPFGTLPCRPLVPSLAPSLSVCILYFPIVSRACGTHVPRDVLSFLNTWSQEGPEQQKQERIERSQRRHRQRPPPKGGQKEALP